MHFMLRTEAREFTGAGGGVFRYRWAEKLPDDGSKVPLVIFLHGAGERDPELRVELVQVQNIVNRGNLQLNQPARLDEIPHVVAVL